MSIANGYGPNRTTAESRGLDVQRRIAELEKQLTAREAEPALGVLFALFALFGAFWCVVGWVLRGWLG